MVTDDNKHWTVPVISYMLSVCDKIELSAKRLLHGVGLHLQKSAIQISQVRTEKIQ